MPALDGADEERVGEWARSRSPLDALVYRAIEGELEDVLADAWVAVREVATGALIPNGQGGRVVMIAPRAVTAPLAAAAQAGFENLARTLSVEWARYQVTVSAIAPGPRAGEDQLAEFVCYLVSVAGGYFSGARFDMG
jgi:NAD(P)-dependent dehydrogenase (short-subunit alcohol dehydrogenase family)